MNTEQTAAEKYAAGVQKQFDDWLESTFSKQALRRVPLFEHTVPSGMTFKVRNLSNEFNAQVGSMPLGLTEAVLGRGEDVDPEEFFNQAKPAEQATMIALVAKQIRFICVEPRLIVGEVNGHRNAISTDRLTIEDFNSLAKRAQAGGDAAKGLRTFRKPRR